MLPGCALHFDWLKSWEAGASTVEDLLGKIHVLHNQYFGFLHKGQVNEETI